MNTLHIPMSNCTIIAVFNDNATIYSLAVMYNVKGRSYTNPIVMENLSNENQNTVNSAILDYIENKHYEHRD